MSIVGIDHINIAAPAPLLEQVRDFYREILGLQDGFRPEFSSPGYWLYAGTSPVVHLSERSAAFVGGDQAHLDHVAFEGQDMDAMLERLQRTGVEYRRSYVAELDLHQLFFTDPAGTGLEVNFRGERMPEKDRAQR